MKMQEEEEWLSMSPPTGQTRRLQPAQIDSTGADVKEKRTNTNADGSSDEDPGVKRCRRAANHARNTFI